jgi:hypothetical protein
MSLPEVFSPVTPRAMMPDMNSARTWQSARTALQMPVFSGYREMVVMEDNLILFQSSCDSSGTFGFAIRRPLADKPVCA